MTPISFIAGIFAAIATAGAVPAVQPGEIRTFKDWAVGCDNGADCQAVSLMPEASGAVPDDWEGPISIIRTAGSDDIFKIHILFQPKQVDRYKMIVDGRLVDTGPIVQGDYPIQIVGTDARKVAQAIISGNRLVIEGPDDEIIARVSLAGSSAALRYIDQKQGRDGTGTALVAKGSRAFRPAVTKIPTISVDRWDAAKRVPETGDIIALAEDSRCKQERFGVVEDQIFPLGKRGNVYRALVLISCGTGAYNFSSAPYIGEYVENLRATSGWTFAPAKFDRQPSWGGEGADPLLVNANWNDQDRTLASYGKGRGIGDCGSAENYVWDGIMFRLIAASAMQECRGAFEWITTWRANHRPLEQVVSATD
ncbi:DUF1176 domain-containing protein [Parasphingorhabdus sp.]|uniref:DUF1176 domain-containing protein n=1 Tax=Parasphingorhabdus sp. TaxID=2709688 RepID=UPI0035944264